MKKLYTFLSVMLLISTASFAQVAPAQAPAQNNRPTQEQIAAQRQEKMKEQMKVQLSKLDKAKLEAQKKSLERRLPAETDSRKKEFLQMRLDVINTLL